MNVRVGMGYDVHKLVKGRKLILGGVEFPGPKGLEGHSDADVLSHAIGDALLGAAALGDLGTHFPPGDAKWKDASSIHLLGLIRAMLEGRGMRVVNVDSSVVCEEPKLAPLREQMTIQIARALKVSGTCVSIKATTNETLGALGRGEGIAAMAVVLLEIGIAIGPSRSSSSEALPL